MIELDQVLPLDLVEIPAPGEGERAELFGHWLALPCPGRPAFFEWSHGRRLDPAAVAAHPRETGTAPVRKPL